MREALLEGLPVRERRASIAGVDTALLEGGEGPPIVLLHGVGSFASEWGLVIPELVPRHRVVAPDLPGLGESVAEPGKRDAQAAVTWLSELIAQTCDQPPVVIGHSLGGALAAHLAMASYSLRGIVLVNSELAWPVSPGAWSDPRLDQAQRAAHAPKAATASCAR